MGIAVDVVLLVILIACVAAGAHKGAVRTLAGLAGVVAAVLLSPRLGTWLAGVLPWVKQENHYAGSVLYTVLAFLLILFAAWLLGRLLNTVCRLPVLHGINRVFGGIFGGVKGVLLVLLLCALLRLSLPLLAVKYPDKIQLSSFDDSVVLQLQEAPVSAASSGSKSAGADIRQKTQTFLAKLPEQIRNPVYAWYDKLLRGDVQAHANQK
ncbi:MULTISPECIES: CvpA family protein [Caproicibacterium]|uniref:CvpA family protein n=1 Tax=Caproicibacterium argilliputei TaxID=3030016 RepID=A0AA97H2X8_9FIRM|nr:CvpA family protein [Caproicibacterium argilliputei]WOC31668.1 CvpA family protein [Caproicibacterium argilliputei]